jgi:hypothetical protein
VVGSEVETLSRRGEVEKRSGHERRPYSNSNGIFSDQPGNRRTVREMWEESVVRQGWILLFLSAYRTLLVGLERCWVGGCRRNVQIDGSGPSGCLMDLDLVVSESKIRLPSS